jgi:hypothetical protein
MEVNAFRADQKFTAKEELLELIVIDEPERSPR